MQLGLIAILQIAIMACNNKVVLIPQEKVIIITICWKISLQMRRKYCGHLEIQVIAGPTVTSTTPAKSSQYLETLRLINWPVRKGEL